MTDILKVYKSFIILLSLQGTASVINIMCVVVHGRLGERFYVYKETVTWCVIVRV